MKNIRKWSLILLPVCLLWVVAPSAMAKNTITCTIVDQDGKPVAKQEFVLQTAGQGKEKDWKKKSNDDGKVEFKGLKDGSYELKAEVQGFVPSTSEPIQVSGDVNKPCNVTIVTAQYANAKLQGVMKLLQAKKVDDAQKEAEEAVKLIPGEASAHYVLAVAYAYNGNDQAVEEAKKAAELNPDQFKAKVDPVQMQMLNVQAENLKAKKDYDGAIKKYEAVLKLSPNEPVALYNMAVTYAAAKDLPKALENIDKFLVFKPDDPQAKRLREAWNEQFNNQLNQDLKK